MANETIQFFDSQGASNMVKIPIFLSPSGRYIAWADNPRYTERGFTKLENHDFD